MSINKIALVGATGNLGPAILKALLDDNYHVTILSREGSTSTDSLTPHPNQTIRKVNFGDVSSIASALTGIQGMVSNVASTALMSQTNMIDAAISAGVTRFLPSEFGSDLTVESNKTVPFNMPKLEIRKYLAEKAAANPKFSYTAVVNGPFFDWCLKYGLFGDLKTHEATLWDGGDNNISITTLASVGRAVCGVFKNLDATKNRQITVADTTITQKQILDIVKEIDGKEWSTKRGDTAESYQLGLQEFQKPEPNYQMAIVNQLYRIMFSPEQGVDFSGKLDNEKVGMKAMSEEEIREVVKSCIA